MRKPDARREHLAEAGRFADEMAFFLETFAGHTRGELMTVVRTHETEEAIGAATRLLAERFRMTVIGDGPDAEFVGEGRRCGRKSQAENAPHPTGLCLDKKRT